MGVIHPRPRQVYCRVRSAGILARLPHSLPGPSPPGSRQRQRCTPGPGTGSRFLRVCRTEPNRATGQSPRWLRPGGGGCARAFSRGGNGISVPAEATTPLHRGSTQETRHTPTPPCTDTERKAPLGSGGRRSLRSDCLLGFSFSSLPLPRGFISSLGVAAARLLFGNAPRGARPRRAESLLAAQVI